MSKIVSYTLAYLHVELLAILVYIFADVCVPHDVEILNILILVVHECNRMGLWQCSRGPGAD